MSNDRIKPVQELRGQDPFMDFFFEAPIDYNKKSDAPAYGYIKVSFYLPDHAIKRARERYGLFLDPKTTGSLYNTIYNDDKRSIELSEGTYIKQKDGSSKYRPGIRYACFFQEEWYLIACHEGNGIILTFLELRFIKPKEKEILKNKRYYRNFIQSDPFGVWSKR